MVQLFLDAINGFLVQIIKSILEWVLKMSAIIFTTGNVLDLPAIKDNWLIILGMANLFMAIFFIYAWQRYTASYVIEDSYYSAKEGIYRLIMAIVGVNLSFWICTSTIELNNSMVREILSKEVRVGGLEHMAKLGQVLSCPVAGTFTGGFMGGLILLAIGLLFLVLIFIYFIRYAAICFLAVTSPFFFASYIISDGWLTVWIRLWIATVFMQLCHAVVFRLWITLPAMASSAPEEYLNLMTAAGLALLTVFLPTWIFRGAILSIGGLGRVKGAIGMGKMVG